MTRMSAAAYQRTACERDIQAGICALLDSLRIPYSVTDAAVPVVSGQCKECGADVKLYARGGKVRKSWPDISAVIKSGRLLAIEVKSATGRFKPGQPEMLAALVKAGALVIVARSIDDVKAAL